MPKVFPFGLTLPADPVVVVKALHEAQAIHRFGVNLAIVQRTVTARRAAAVHALCADLDVNIDVTFDAHPLDYDKQVAQALTPDISALLGDDIAALVYWFVVFGGTPSIRLQLATSNPAPAPAFIAERLPLRLAVAYSGFGLQWVQSPSARYHSLSAPEALAASNHTSISEPGAIRVLRPWWVAFIKGNGYLGNDGNGLVYRPSPQRMLSERRLQLTLDSAY